MQQAYELYMNSNCSVDVRDLTHRQPSINSSE